METSIYLWGPSGSGKTWLIRAFERKILLLNAQRNNARFKLSLVDIDSGANITHLQFPSVGPNSSLVRERYLFIRKALFDGLDAQVSTHAHETWIFDDMGGVTIFDEGLAAEPNDTYSGNQYPQGISTSDQMHQEQTTTDSAGNNPGPNMSGGMAGSLRLAQIEASRRRLLRSTNIILLLDPGSRGTQSYLDALRRLREVLLMGNPDAKRRIAACVTKADQTGFFGGGAAFLTEDDEIRELVFARFSDSAIEILRILKELDDMPDCEVKLFAVSAFGYLQDSKTPNFATDSFQILDKNRWQPINVEKPFFWLFENVERERLGASGRALTGAFSSLFARPLAQSDAAKENLVSKARSRAYISYDEM